MTQWRLGCAGSLDVTQGTTMYGSILPGAVIARTTETSAGVQAKFYIAYTCTDLRAKVTQNTGTSTLTLRDDAADTTVAVSLSATGWAEDLTDSATPASGSLVDVSLVQTSNMHDDLCFVSVVMLTIEHASSKTPLWGGRHPGTFSLNTFAPLAGQSTAASATRANVETEMQRAVAFSSIRVNATGITGTWTVAPMKNGTASSNVAVTVTASGAAEDVTGSESFAVGDKACFSFNEDVGGTYSEGLVQINGDSDTQLVNTPNTPLITTRAYSPFNGTGWTTTAEDQFLSRIGSVTAANFQTVCVTAGSGTRDAGLRVASTNSTNLTVSITATGYFEDLTGSDTVADGDSLQATAVSTGGSIELTHASVEIPWTPGSQSVAPNTISSGSIARNPTVVINQTASPTFLSSAAQVYTITKVDQTPILPAANGTSTGDNGGGGTSITLNKPTGVGNGRMMLACISVFLSGTVTITPPSGWVSIAKRVQGSAITQETFWKIAGSSEPSTYQWTLDGSLFSWGVIMTYEGQHGSAPIDVSGVNGGNSGTSLTAPSVTVTNDSSRIVTVYSILTDQAVTEPPGFFERIDYHNSNGGAHGTALYDRPASAGASGTFVATVGSSGVWVAQTIAVIKTAAAQQTISNLTFISSTATVYSTSSVSKIPIGAKRIATMAMTQPLQHTYRPVHVAGSNRYVVLADGSGANITTIRLFKSTDGGDTWAEQDASNRPTLTGNKRFTGVHSLLNSSADGNSTVIDVLAQIYNDTAGNDFMHYRFRFATDSWNPTGWPKTAMAGTGNNADLRTHGCTGNSHSGEIDTGYMLLSGGNRQVNHLLYAGTWGNDGDADGSLVDLDGVDELTGISTNVVNYLLSDDGTFYYQQLTDGTQYAAATSVHVDDRKQVIIGNGHANLLNGPTASYWLVPYWRLNGTDYEFRLGRSSAYPTPSFTEHLVRNEGAIGAGFKPKDVATLQPYFVVVWTRGDNSGALYLILTRDGRFYSPINDLGGSYVSGVRLCYGQEEGNTDVEMLLEISSSHIYWLKKTLASLSDPDIHPNAVSATSQVYTITDVEVITGASPNFIASTAVVSGPAIQIEASPGHIVSTAAVNGPVIRVTVDPATIVSGSTAGSPSVAFVVNPATIASGSTVYAPSNLRLTAIPDTIASTDDVPALSVAFVVAPDTIAPGSTAYGSSNVRLTVVPSTVAAGSSIYGPSIRCTVIPGTVASVSTAYDPTVGASTAVVPDAITSAGVVFDPAAIYVANPDAIGSTSTVSNPALQITVTLATISSVAVAYDPSVSAPMTVLPNAVASTASVPNPAIANTQIASPNAISSSSSVPSLGITYVAAPNTIAAGSAAYGPTIRLSVSPGTIAAASVVNNPAVTILLEVVPDAVASGSSAYGPTVVPDQTASPGTIASTASVYQPALILTVYMRPDGTVSNPGVWTANGGPSTLWECIDEAPPVTDPGDYIASPVGGT